MDSHFEQKKDFFLKILKQNLSAWGHGGHRTAPAPPLQPQGPQRGKGVPSPVDSIPWPQEEGAQCLAQLQGQLQHGAAPRPTERWLPRPAASVSPCGNAIPNPTWCFQASADTQHHPRAAQPHEKATCSSPYHSPGTVTRAAWPVFPARPFSHRWQGPALACQTLCVTGATGVP